MQHFPPLIKFALVNAITSIVKPLPLIYLLSIFSYLSCTDSETARNKNVNPAEIYFDYKIRGEEKDSDVTVFLRFKVGGPNGTTIFLTDPAKVELDGEPIPVDSAKRTGAYYEIRMPAKGFEGKHSILFTGLDNEEYREDFVYKPFRLKTKLPSVIDRGDIVFDIDGLEAEDYLRVSLIDTSFRSRDINEIDTVKNGRLIIPVDKLKNLVDGPITVLLYKDVEKPVKDGTKAGGRIVVSYGLQREFELRPPPSLPQ